MSVLTWLDTAATAPSALGVHFDFGKPGAAPVADALKIILVLTVLAVLPAILVAMTSFTRIVIVLSMIRHGLGMQDTPPNLVLISIAMFLTLFTMSPALEVINSNSVQPLLKNQVSLADAVNAGIQPLREFMIRQTREKDLELILEVAHTPIPDSVKEVKTVHLVPAFLLSELKTGFQIGFVIFLPFLLIDLVVASILMSMGMLMVPPTIISLPFKILMFVLIDGWSLTVRALLGSFH
jgi:flagellar biosynthetic protein FliP